MLVTEEEAKEKWCPYGRALPVDMAGGQIAGGKGWPAHNRTYAGGAEGTYVTFDVSRCIAFGCMSWRWWDGARLSVLSRDDCEDQHKMEQGRQDHNGKRRGYCGLSGKPE